MSQDKYDASHGIQTIKVRSADTVKLQMLQHAAFPGIVQVKSELSQTHNIHPVYDVCEEMQWQGQVPFTSNASFSICDHRTCFVT